MAIHSSILAWKIPWTEEPGGLQSMGSQRVGHDLATSLTFTVTFIKRLFSSFLISAIKVVSYHILLAFYRKVLVVLFF